MEISDETIDLLLGALADQLQALGSHAEIVGQKVTALTALGLVRRATRDVDLLFAMAEQGGGRHEADLRALSPTPGELAAAARRSTTRDPPPGYRSVLVDALRVLGVNDFAEHGFIRPPPQGPASRTSRTRPFR